jgi:hypothetical protein
MSLGKTLENQSLRLIVNSLEPQLSKILVQNITKGFLSTKTELLRYDIRSAFGKQHYQTSYYQDSNMLILAS